MPPAAKPLTPSIAKPSPRQARQRGRPARDAGASVAEHHLLDRAFLAFAQRGYEGTTLRGLAKDLGISHNLLNVRFGSKDDLWRRAVDARVARIGPPVFAAIDAPGLDDTTRFKELIHRLCAWSAENPDFVSLIHSEGRVATWRLDYLVQAHILPFKLRLEALISRLAATRPVRDISTPAIMALLVQGVAFYFASWPLLEKIDEPADISRDRRIRIFAEFILAGLL
jgi:TetR/AcrR family transcriptional regulator